MGRSRSRPLGRIISLIEPLASGKERRSQLYTRQPSYLFFFLLFLFILFLFFRGKEPPQAPSRPRPKLGWRGLPETAVPHLAAPPKEGEKKPPKPNQQRMMEGAVGAQGSGNNPLSPFKNRPEYVVLTVRHCGITHGPSGRLGRDPPGRALCLECRATLCSPWARD